MRCFIAIDLPPEIKAEIGRQQAALRAALAQAPARDQKINWTRPDGIHLTLKFLGETDRVNEMTEALQGIGPFEKFSVEVKGFGFFPDARRPRVLWTGIEAPPGLRELASRVETAIEPCTLERRATGPSTSRSARPCGTPRRAGRVYSQRGKTPRPRSGPRTTRRAAR